jgi:hypothetical protein
LAHFVDTETCTFPPLSVAKRTLSDPDLPHAVVGQQLGAGAALHDPAGLEHIAAPDKADRVGRC